jgi:hypothetical protein
VDSNFRFRDALSSPTARPWVAPPDSAVKGGSLGIDAGSAVRMSSDAPAQAMAVSMIERVSSVNCLVESSLDVGEHPASCHELDRVRPPRLGRPLRVALPQELFTLEPGFAIP